MKQKKDKVHKKDKEDEDEEDEKKWTKTKTKTKKMMKMKRKHIKKMKTKMKMKTKKTNKKNEQYDNIYSLPEVRKRNLIYSQKKNKNLISYTILYFKQVYFVECCFSRAIFTEKQDKTLLEKITLNYHQA